MADWHHFCLCLWNPTDGADYDYEGQEMIRGSDLGQGLERGKVLGPWAEGLVAP